MRSLFVTGSGTGVGKTLVTCALAVHLRGRGRRVDAAKPVASGFDPGDAGESDTGRIARALGRSLDAAELAAVSPWRFAAPLSPDMAAAREGRRIEFEELVEGCRARLAGDADLVLVEGVGGVMVPLDERRTVLDWIAALGWPAVVVAGSYLGTLSHTLTAVRVLEERGVPASVVVSESETSPVALAETVAVLARHLPGHVVAALPRVPDAGPTRERLLEAVAADLACALGIGTGRHAPGGSGKGGGGRPGSP